MHEATRCPPVSNHASPVAGGASFSVNPIADAFVTTGPSGNLSGRRVRTRMRPWTCNEFVIVGPRSDPAGIRGLHNGAVALERISRAQAPFVDFQKIGTRELTTKLDKTANVRPRATGWAEPRPHVAGQSRNNILISCQSVFVASRLAVCIR